MQPQNAMKITFIGGGNMANAILEGCFTPGTSFSCSVIETDEQRRIWLEQRYQLLKTGPQITAEISDSAMIILAVKPQQIAEVLEALYPFLKDNLIVSIAAGVRLEKLSRCLQNYKRIIRAMPNMAALVHQSMTGLVALDNVNIEERRLTEKLMQTIGEVLWFAEENQLDAVTAVSGSGPAYVFYFIEALQEAAKSLGLSEEQAKQLALKTFSGASHLALTSPESTATLRHQVTSKGGTTEAALNHLEQEDIKQHIIDAVRAAAQRSRELGGL